MRKYNVRWWLTQAMIDQRFQHQLNAASDPAWGLSMRPIRFAEHSMPGQVEFIKGVMIQ